MSKKFQTVDQNELRNVDGGDGLVSTIIIMQGFWQREMQPGQGSSSSSSTQQTSFARLNR
jgi:hypothetical protein